MLVRRTEPVPVDVKAVVEDVVRLLHAAMLIRRIEIRLLSAGAVPRVSGDPVQLEQVLLNVVTNAVEAIEAGGEGARIITITLAASDVRPGYVLVEVADTGVGVQGAELERIFEHFVSTKPKGLGMGLAISRSIIHRHGGRMWATARRDRGLVVHIELPCSAEARSPADAAVHSAR